MPKAVALQNYPVRQIQCALAARGADVAVDGAFGPQTHGALQAALTAYKAGAPNSEVAQGASFEAPPFKSRTVSLSVGFADWLLNAAPECRQLQAQGAAPVVRDAQGAGPLGLVQEPFWRLDNWKAWAVAIGAAAAIGGLGYYGYKKRWFR